MRVALDVTAIPPRLTGAGTYVHHLADALGRHAELELHLIARRDDAARWAPMGTVHAVAPTPRPVRLAWEQASAPALARRIGADVWHGPHYTMPVRLRRPTVVTVHDLTFFDHPEHHQRMKVPVFRRAITVAARQATALVCVSDRTADRLQSLLPVQGRVVVAPHGVDHDRFTPDGDRDEDLAALVRVGIRPPYVAYLGTIEPRKNVPGLVRAFARVQRNHPDLRLVLAGLPGWGSDDVDRAVAHARVGDAVDRVGYLDAAVVPAFLRRADAVAYPAFEEGFGLPVLEALACGAVVITSAGTVMEDVADGAAVLAPPGDDDALARAIDRAVAGDADVDARRARGPDVASRYTWAATADVHVALYRDLVVG